jgi:hypothetical protein
MSGSSPYMHAAMVSTVYGGNNRLLPSDDWPYMRTAQDGFAAVDVKPTPIKQETERAPLKCTPPSSDWSPVGCPQEALASNLPQQEMSSNLNVEGNIAGGSYTKLVKSATLPLYTMGVPKHVFKVRETSKLILFLGAAAGGIILLDLSARLLISIAHNKCNGDNK